MSASGQVKPPHPAPVILGPDRGHVTGGIFDPYTWRGHLPPAEAGWQNHGLQYVSRDGVYRFWLDGPNFDPAAMPRPERDVAIALLRYALERFESAAVIEHGTPVREPRVRG